MKSFKYLGAALALTLATSAFAMGDCCKDCCKHDDGKKAECCEKHKDVASGKDDHAGHADHGKVDTQPK